MATFCSYLYIEIGSCRILLCRHREFVRETNDFNLSVLVKHRVSMATAFKFLVDSNILGNVKLLR